ncbi:hypothetical protein PPERSA_03401 [Pseudocohnilembus persalinus]|uniref:Uncharacterized protein n=1 Tax=Pseudocohnilembus persalinus TaxID=266149 RepID=A0A0V0Q826_PSEPJ|nr:hypothetical protein PPERSA_03401 [Pseudocohnilembus persalinus]|eukprot:KRW98199.1 hypothetical protein PPERSA_03401 [Pseudocohnilembus persalinus]
MMSNKIGLNLKDIRLKNTNNKRNRNNLETNYFSSQFNQSERSNLQLQSQTKIFRDIQKPQQIIEQNFIQEPNNNQVASIQNQVQNQFLQNKNEYIQETKINKIHSHINRYLLKNQKNEELIFDSLAPKEQKSNYEQIQNKTIISQLLNLPQIIQDQLSKVSDNAVQLNRFQKWGYVEQIQTIYYTIDNILYLCKFDQQVNQEKFVLKTQFTKQFQNQITTIKYLQNTHFFIDEEYSNILIVATTQKLFFFHLINGQNSVILQEINQSVSTQGNQIEKDKNLNQSTKENYNKIDVLEYLGQISQDVVYKKINKEVILQNRDQCIFQKIYAVNYNFDSNYVHLIIYLNSGIRLYTEFKTKSLSIQQKYNNNIIAEIKQLQLIKYPYSSNLNNDLNDVQKYSIIPNKASMSRGNQNLIGNQQFDCLLFKKNIIVQQQYNTNSNQAYQIQIISQNTAKISRIQPLQQNYEFNQHLSFTQKPYEGQELVEIDIQNQLQQVENYDCQILSVKQIKQLNFKSQLQTSNYVHQSTNEAQQLLMQTSNNNFIIGTRLTNIDIIYNLVKSQLLFSNKEDKNMNTVKQDCQNIIDQILFDFVNYFGLVEFTSDAIQILTFTNKNYLYSKSLVMELGPQIVKDESYQSLNVTIDQDCFTAVIEGTSNFYKAVSENVLQLNNEQIKNFKNVFYHNKMFNEYFDLLIRRLNYCQFYTQLIKDNQFQQNQTQEISKTSTQYQFDLYKPFYTKEFKFYNEQQIELREIINEEFLYFANINDNYVIKQTVLSAVQKIGNMALQKFTEIKNEFDNTMTKQTSNQDSIKRSLQNNLIKQQNDIVKHMLLAIDGCYDKQLIEQIVQKILENNLLKYLSFLKSEQKIFDETFIQDQNDLIIIQELYKNIVEFQDQLFKSSLEAETDSTYKMILKLESNLLYKDQLFLSDFIIKEIVEQILLDKKTNLEYFLQNMNNQRQIYSMLESVDFLEQQSHHLQTLCMLGIYGSKCLNLEYQLNFLTQKQLSIGQELQNKYKMEAPFQVILKQLQDLTDILYSLQEFNNENLQQYD